MKKSHIIFLLSLLLSACGLSPQIVDINPSLSDSGIPSTPNSIKLMLTVMDARENPVLGQRGGVYKDTSIIKTEGDITIKIQQRLIEVFNKAGFTIDSTSNIHINVSIINLSYHGHGENRVSKVETAAEILVTVSKPGGKYSKTYKASHIKEVLKAPNEDKNEELINQNLASVIQRVLDDEEMYDYIMN